MPLIAPKCHPKKGQHIGLKLQTMFR